jgi:hypothetical protein
MSYTSSAGLFIFSGITHFILAVYLSYRVIRRDSSPMEDHIAFNDALNATHTASQIYEYEDDDIDTYSE